MYICNLVFGLEILMPGIFLGLKFQACVFFWVCNMNSTPPPPPGDMCCHFRNPNSSTLLCFELWLELESAKVISMTAGIEFITSGS